MISSHPAFLYTILDPELYETIDTYRPGDEYSSVVGSHLGEGWTMRPKGYWTMCQGPDGAQLAQGWKIHLSASPASAKDLLGAAVPVLVTASASFKFCSDENMLRLSLNKNAPRTGAGKFVTVYPDGRESFLEVIERLHAATRTLRGPFLLTDRPYRDSQVVFYRYGEHYGYERVAVDGHRLPSLRAPSGEWISDERRAFFQVPPWESDPCSAEAPPATPGEEGVLLKDRYRVLGAFKFLALGAVYRGTDLGTGEAVVIREARPERSDGGEEEGFQLLEKEARILQKLGGTGYVPRFVDLFREWEHLFLVQERIEAESLWGYAMSFANGSAALRPAEVFRRLRSTIRDVVRALITVHEQGVVLRDLTRNNVMITPDRHVKFIDFEFAYELDGGQPAVLNWTPGHTSPDQLRGATPRPADDGYSAGALILDMVTFTAPGLDLNREGVLASFRQTLEDYALPSGLFEIVAGLLEPEPERRWPLERVLEVLDRLPEPTADVPVVPVGIAPPERPAPSPELLSEIDLTLQELASYTLAVADLERDDRLWPVSAEAFQTNPLNLHGGAVGPAQLLQTVTGSVPRAMLDWLLDHFDVERYPPGLMSGLAGVSWVFEELGLSEAAREAMEVAAGSGLRHQRAELYWGAAGWGLANLRFWSRTGEAKYLERALETGGYLVETAESSRDGRYWSLDGEIPLGLGHGQSGPALFLIYLDAANPGEGFLELAIAAIDFELAQRTELDDELLWFPRVGAPVNAPKSPHMRHGTAGIGSAVLRAYLASGEDRLLRFADRCALTVSSRQTNKLWFDYGLAGYGELLLDMHRLLGDENYRHNAFYLAEALLKHRIVKAEGVAFPAEELFRISCDFAAGAAGIGLFLHRLANPGTPRFLMLDELLVVRDRRPEALAATTGDA